MMPSYTNIAQRIVLGHRIPGMSDEVQEKAYMKLRQLSSVSCNQDFEVLPGYPKKKLTGKYNTLYSMTLDDQRRILFKWYENTVSNVQVICYHLFEYMRENPRIGDIILEDFMKPVNMSSKELADGLGISVIDAHMLINSSNPITPELAKKLEAFLGWSADMWLSLQEEYKKWEEADGYKRTIAYIIRILEYKLRDALGSEDILTARISDISYDDDFQKACTQALKALDGIIETVVDSAYYIEQKRQIEELYADYIREYKKIVGDRFSDVPVSN